MIVLRLIEGRQETHRALTLVALDGSDRVMELGKVLASPETNEARTWSVEAGCRF